MKEFKIKPDRQFLMKRMGDICEIQQAAVFKAGAVEAACGIGLLTDLKQITEFEDMAKSLGKRFL